MAKWLMKSEPDCYSIEDLERGGPSMWEGCRNYTVRNFFRDSMQPGDMAFFYHSNCTPPGVVGTMRILGNAYPDPTQFDLASNYHDPKSPQESPRWLTRDVELVERYPSMVTLTQLRETPGLEEMLLLRKGQRLSVLPVADAEWDIIVGLARR